MRDHDSPAWYRQFWPWFLISFPLAAVLAGVATFWIAATNTDGLVEDDYYKQGMTINRTLDRDRAAARAQLAGRLRMTTQGAALDLRGQLTRMPDRVWLRILHPTRAGMDQKILLTRQPDGRYAGAARPPGPGKWHLQLQDEGGVWRLLGEWNGADAEAALEPAKIE